MRAVTSARGAGSSGNLSWLTVASDAIEAVSKKIDEMLTFRTSITCAVMAFIAALAALSLVIQLWTFHLAAKAAASAHMDAASIKALGHLQDEISEITSLVRVLSTGSSIAGSDDRPEAGRAIPLFKAALVEVPQMDSIYVGYDNRVWLQVRPLNDLSDEQRSRIRAPAGAAGINVSRPAPEGDLPMRRIFEDPQGNELDQLDLWKYGYDPRQRRRYVNTIEADRTVVWAAFADKVASEQLNAHAVVGNYTALGSVVNLTSRLEGLNKQYGTTILASGDVYRRLHEYFRFKEIGSVIAKGSAKRSFTS